MLIHHVSYTPAKTGNMPEHPVKDIIEFAGLIANVATKVFIYYM